MAVKGSRGSKAKKLEAAEQDAVLTTVKSVKASDALSDLAQIQVSVQKQLADIGATLTDRIQQVETLNTGIGLLEARLKELHDIEAAAIKIDDLEAQIENLEVEASDREAESLRTWQEKENDRQKAWKRAEDEYSYNLSLQRKKAADDYAAQQAATLRAESIRKEALEKSWAEREAALKAQENEVTNLRAQVADFPNVVKKEVSKEVAIETNRLTRDHKQQTELLSKDAEMAKRLAEAEVASLKASNASLVAQIADLQEQLVSARADAKEVAQKALEASSKSALADTLQRVVESKDNQQKGSGR